MNVQAPGRIGAGEAAPGIEAIDVKPVNKAEDRPLYESRPPIHPKLVHGRFRSIKWAIMAVTLGIYYLLPWLRWDRGAGLPDQAVLFDFAERRFYIFFLEIWPQEIYLLTGVLVFSCLALFLVTAVAGRVWCGYTCPQTVWTDLFIAVERFFEGDRNARIRLDRQPWRAGKIGKKLAKHVTWVVIAVATGGAFVFYFRDAPTLALELLTFQAPTIAYVFVGIFAGTTYLLGGLARDQVCIYMCPWPRIQGAMFDSDSLLVTYRDWRGEPRGPHRHGQTWEGRGDCIDCKQCVVVCPMGIDIRDGPQLECIQCALCIDACDDIMDKVGRPRGLIAYDTFNNMEAEAQGGSAKLRLIRPRTIYYGAALAIVGLLILVGLFARESLEVNVLHDRNPLYVQLSDGGLRNGYTIKVVNKRHGEREMTLGVSGLEDAGVRILGEEGLPRFTAAADDVVSLRVYVTVPPQVAQSLTRESYDIRFTMTDDNSGDVVMHDAVFRAPGE